MRQGGGAYFGVQIPAPTALCTDHAAVRVYIPGVGTYTARVVLYRDQYAGTWSGKNYGGQLFGKIIHERR